MSKFIFSGFADEAGSELETQIKVLKETGIENVELRNVNRKNISAYTPEEAAELYKTLQENGISVSAVGSPIGKIRIEDDFEPHFEVFKNTIEVAKALNTKYIRMFSFHCPEGDYTPYEKEVFNRLEKFVKYAQGTGVTLLHENEKAIYGDMADRCLKIAEAFKGELFLTFDPSNFVQCDQNTIEAFEMLKPYVRYMHFKDSTLSEVKATFDQGFDPKAMGDTHRLVGHGDGNFRYILKELDKMGYEGFCSLEPHIAMTSIYEGTPYERWVLAAKTAKELVKEVTGA
ncbi:MAG: sugar phosphate isomerase/epimerase [Clostridia bacterium]|nr:sugar phosphate isomerase/epimerase [Clostridia bacterium]